MYSGAAGAGLPRQIITVSAEGLNSLTAQLQAVMGQSEGTGAQVRTQQTRDIAKFHLVPGAQAQFMSAANMDLNANSATASIAGTAGPFPVSGGLRVEVDTDAARVNASIDFLQPVAASHTASFLMQDVELERGDLVRASGVAIDPSFDVAGQGAQGVGAMGLSWWCVAGCGGTAIAGTLVACLGAASGGWSNYVRCVTGRLGETAASVAFCVVTDCIS